MCNILSYIRYDRAMFSLKMGDFCEYSCIAEFIKQIGEKYEMRRLIDFITAIIQGHKGKVMSIIQN